jgi:general secretion pathway protein D
MRNTLELWRKTRATACITAAFALAALLAGASAQAVMLQVKDAPLKQVVSLLVEQSGANVVIQDASALDRRITASLTDVPLEKALNYIVRSAGVSYKKTEDGTYIIGGIDLDEPAVPKEVIVPTLPAVTEPVAPAVQERTFALIKLMHSSPSELLRVLGWNGQTPIDNGELLTRMRNDRNPPRQMGQGFYDGKTGQPINTTPGVDYRNGQPIPSTIDPAALNPGSGRTADSMTGAGQFPGDAGGRPNYVTNPGAPPRTSSSTTQSNSSSSNFLMPDGIDEVKAFDLDNSIIVKGTEDAIEKFKKIIRMLDVPPQQVQVKAEFVEVTTNDVKSFGIDWSLQRLNESFATAFQPSGNVVVGFATGNLAANLRAQLTSNIGTVINSPIISTLNNQFAQIQISTVIPYWTSYATVTDTTTINNSYANFINVETHLDVLPRVNGDGTITMILRPGVADTGALVTGPDGTSIPEQRTQELMTQRRVANGETIVVGGFIRKNDTEGYQKIPVLGDLPLIGSLFRTVNKTKEDRELLIFITPTIIPPTGGGTVGETPVP